MEELAAAMSLLKNLPERSPVEDYLWPFVQNPLEQFICFYDILPNKVVVKTSYSRAEFWQLVLQCVTVLTDRGMTKGDCHVHYFSGNSVIDLALRTASVLLGTIPVTVNWQADTLDLVTYKVEITKAKLVVIDARTPLDNVSSLKTQFPSCAFVSASDVASTPAYSDGITSLLQTRPLVSAEDTRCIIFTSGTTGKPKGNNYIELVA